MNKEYFYINDQVIVEDRYRNKRMVDNCDNLEELLIQENVIETIENKIQDLKKENKRFKTNKKRVILPFIRGIIMVIVISAVFPMTLYCVGGGAGDVIINTIFGSMKFSTFMTIIGPVIGTYVGGFYFSLDYRDYKQEHQEQNGIINTIEFLQKDLEIEKEKYEELQKNKNNVNEKTEVKKFKVVQINDTERLQELTDRIALYHDCGYNGKKYYKYYQKHCELPKKILKMYDDEEQDFIEEYLEEKGPQLVKRKIR